jgi:hypothetical protein
MTVSLLPRCALASLWVMFNLLCCALAGAQEAQVRARLQNAEPVWVGQQMILDVELLVPGYFASAASFDLPDPGGVLLMPPTHHPVIGTETIEGIEYTVQRHELRAWPMRAGEQTIPSLGVRFAYKRQPLDTAVIPASGTTAPMPFSVKLPPDAEQRGTVVSARELTVEEHWQPEPGEASVKAGMAFTRTVTFRAPGVPGMVFPAFPADPIDGLGVYSTPQLLDEDDGMTLVGVREDRLSYIAKRPGQFSIPATRYTWFDLDSEQLRTVELPARMLTVIANPDLDSAAHSSAGEQSSPWRRVGLVAALLLLSVVAGTRRPLRRLLARIVAPLRPVHLQPLHPRVRTRPASSEQ